VSSGSAADTADATSHVCQRLHMQRPALGTALTDGSLLAVCLQHAHAAMLRKDMAHLDLELLELKLKLREGTLASGQRLKHGLRAVGCGTARSACSGVPICQSVGRTTAVLLHTCQQTRRRHDPSSGREGA
jgi:hypothetical protein